MKKVFLFFVCVATFAGANAQLKYGIKAGANLSNYVGDDVEDSKSKIGFNAGVFVEFPLASSISLRPELVYSDQGAKGESDGVDSKINAGYLNIPVLAKWSSEGGFFAETGPQIGFLLNAKAKAGDIEVDAKEAYKSVDFAWAFGLGYHITPSIGVNGRYNLGISNVSENDNAKVRNSVFQLGLFYTFGSASVSN